MLIVCNLLTGGCTARSTELQGRINMKSILVTVSTLLVTFAGIAHAADDTDALIALDKQWGESAVKGDTTVSAKLLAEKVVSVSETGIRGKQAELADMKPEPAGTRYEPSDYKVTFINPDTAIMTHSAKGTDAHYSLHVWSRKGGTWQIIATSTTPAKSGK
jgi:Domain of unknown function (DUF4440)